MKKIILLLFFCLLAFLSIILLPTNFPQIEITINIEPSHKSVVQAQESNRSESEELGCVVLHNYDLDEIDDEISSLYLRGYRLEDFSVMPLKSGVIAGYAAICKG